MLLAGDLNRHYRSREYPRSTLTSYGMTPTWDMTGQVVPTGDHQGATIDYIFVRDAGQFAVTRQITRELFSDHDALVANLTLNPKVVLARPATTFVRGHVVNIPTSPSGLARRAVLSKIIKAIGLSPAGSLIQVATGRLGDPIVYNALRNAFKRGVHVQLVTTNSARSSQEKALFTLLGSSKARKSWAVQRPFRSAANLAPAVVLINRTADVQSLGIQVDRTLDYQMSVRLARGQLTVEQADFLSLRSGFYRQAK